MKQKCLKIINNKDKLQKDEFIQKIMMKMIKTIINIKIISKSNNKSLIFFKRI